MGDVLSAGAAEEKVRLTLRLVPTVRNELKGRARRLGLSPSAYVTLLLRDEIRRAGD